MSPIILALLSALPKMVPILLPSLVPALSGIIDKYQTGQITKDQLQSEISKALLDAFTSVEATDVEGISKTFSDFIAAADHNPRISRTWATVVYIQLAVLVWFQVGIPAIVYFYGKPWPSSGNTAEWSYGLLLLTLGGGAAMLRVGPTSGAGIIAKLKSLVGLK